MLLNIGNPAWPDTLRPIPQYPALQEDVTCDCLIIGGGMGGALLAYKLTEHQIDTILLEKGSIGAGSTAANTGLMQYSNDKTLTSMIHTFGEEQGVTFYRMCQKAVQDLQTISGKLVIDPQFIPRSSLYYASSSEDVPMLQEEYKLLRKYGLHADYWDSAQIQASFPFAKPGALYTYGDAELNPFRFVHGLVATAASRGLRTYEHSVAMRYEYQADGVVCHTRTNRIHAKKVIYTMGYETQEFKKDSNALLTTSYAILTNPVRDLSCWKDRSLIWETARPYLYLRTTPDNRIVAGGLDENFTNPEEREIRLNHQQQVLLQEVQKLFPSFRDLKVEHAWASVFGSTHDGMPMIGPHPHYPNSYFVEAYGGNGTVYCMMAADLLADELQGRHRSEMDMFSLTRTNKPSP